MAITCPNKKLKSWKDLVASQGKNTAYVLWSKYDGNVPGKYYQEQKVFKTIEVKQPTETLYQNNTNQSNEDYIASEKTIRDLAARMADRIGLKVKYESDRTLDYKGKLEGNTAVINLAYADLTTPIHEILGHPIIRAIKKNTTSTFEVGPYEGGESLGTFNSRKDAQDFIDNHPHKDILGISDPNIKASQLYQNLLKELETGKGKEVLDRVKRDYKYKENEYTPKNFDEIVIEPIALEESDNPFDTHGYFIKNNGDVFVLKNIRNKVGWDIVPFKNNIQIEESVYFEEYLKEHSKRYDKPYTLEEQQEEAIVELLGLYTADRLDNVKDGKLISLLKRLLKSMKTFMRDLFNQKEIEINKLPDNMTLGDIADLLAYSNSKLILPGNEVIYTTPDNQTFKTYQEASNHISELTKLGEVDLSNVNIDYSSNKDKKIFSVFVEGELQKDNLTYKEAEQLRDSINDQAEDNIAFIPDGNSFEKADVIQGFIAKNKEYEQSKEIIEEWKKVNDIKYDPEEVYSRGQGFYSVVGAYSDFDVELMFQNLLTHIEDNKKSGGTFTVSAFTKPVDRKIGHLEGGGGKIKFKIFPKSEDIKWAANEDVYSGSVWDASEKVNKDKKSEIIGVSYTKSPSLRSINTVQPNLADIIDNLAHHHNELGIELTGDNFRLEYDDNIPYSTKKLLDNINKILDSRFGKLVEPEIKKRKLNEGQQKITKEEYNSIKGNVVYEDESTVVKKHNGITYTKSPDGYFKLLKESLGKQPTQTKENLKESINNVSNNILSGGYNKSKGEAGLLFNLIEKGLSFEEAFTKFKKLGGVIEGRSKDYYKNIYNDIKSTKKEYTSQAEINTKVAALKYGQRKFPRSLIRSEVRPSASEVKQSDLFDIDELPFQKVPKDIEVVPLKNYEILYDSFNLLDKDGAVFKYNTKKEAKKKLDSLDNIEYYDFVVKQTDKGKWQVFIEKPKGINPIRPLLESYETFTPLASDSIQEEVNEEALKNNNSEMLRLKEEQMKDANESLDAKLTQIMSTYDISIQDLSALKDRVNVDALGLTRFIAKAGKIMPEIYVNSEHDLMTIPEEVGHVLYEMINGTSFQQRMDAALRKNDLYKNVLGENLEKYQEEYNNNVDKLVKEAAGKAIGEAFITESKPLKQQPTGIQFILQKVWNYIQKVIGKFPFNSMKYELDLLTKDMVKDVYSGEFKGSLDNITREDTFYRIGDLKTHEKIANEVKKSTMNRVKNYQLKDKDTLAQSELERAEKLYKLFEEGKYAEGNLEYLQQIAKESSRLKTSLDEIKKIDSSSNLIKAAGRLRDMKFYHDNIAYTIEDLKTTLKQELKSTDSNKIKEANQIGLDTIKQLEEDLEEMLYTYYTVGNEIMVPLFKPFFGGRGNKQLLEEFNNKLPKNKRISLVDLETLFIEKEGDISTLSRFLNSLAETDDTALQLLDLFVKSEKEKGRLDTLDTVQDLLTLNDTIKDGGKFMVAVDSKGKGVGEFVREYDWVELNKASNAINEKQNKELKEAKKKFTDLTELEKAVNKINNKYKTIRNNEVYRKHAMSIDAARELVEAKKKLVEEGKLSQKEFNKWMYYNVKVTETYSEEFGADTLYTIPLKKSEQYKKIQSNPAQKKYYDFVLDQKFIRDSYLPESQRSGALLPQLYADTIDKVKTLKTKKDLADLLKRGKEFFSQVGDESDRAVKWEVEDAEGNPVKFVPIRYNKRLDNPQMISSDITMSMSVYLGMADNFRYMRQSMDLVELTSDMIKNTKVIKKDNQGNILMSSVKGLTDKIKSRLESKDSKGFNREKRLESYLNMQFYGELTKDAGKILGGKVDVAKLAGTLGMYTALNQLSINIAGAQDNLLLGKSQERIEALSKEFHNFSDLIYADKQYLGKEMGKKISQIGKHNPNDKISLWTNSKNTLQDYSKGLRNMDTNRNTIFSKLFNTSSLFFLQQGGEHYLQTRSSIALANTYRYDPVKGDFVWKNDYYKEFKNLEYKERQEIKDIPTGKKAKESGISTKQEVKKIQDKYKAEKIQIKEKLDKSWNELTNYYDAYEVKGNKLVLKEGFKETHSTHTKFINRQNSINNSIHGIYNDIDRSAFQQYWFAQLVLMFRKWMIPNFNRRYKNAYYNLEKDAIVEGYYKTFFRVLSNDLRQGSFSYQKNFNSLTDTEKANFVRALSEVATFITYLGAALIFTSLAEASGDDRGDDDFITWILNYLAYIYNRMGTNLGVLTPSIYTPNELIKIIQTPSAVTTPIEELINLSKFWKWGEELEAGKYKGWTKFEKHAFRMLPVSKPMHNFLNPEEAMKFYTMGR